MVKNKTPQKKPSQKPEDDNTDDQDGTDGEDGDDKEDDSQDENQRINAIVTSRVKREMKAVNQQLAALTEMVGKLGTGGKKEDDEDGDTDEETPKQEVKVDPKLTRKMSKLENELKEEREARKKAEKESAEKEERAKGIEMRTIFESALTEHGVTDAKQRRAALLVLEADGVMIRDEDGKPKFKGVDKYGIETLFDPKAGVKSWVLGEGKNFAPAVDAGGSGTGGSRQGLGNTAISKGEYGKLTPQAKASIELERASQGLPPLE